MARTHFRRRHRIQIRLMWFLMNFFLRNNTNRGGWLTVLRSQCHRPGEEEDRRDDTRLPPKESIWRIFFWMVYLGSHTRNHSRFIVFSLAIYSSSPHRLGRSQRVELCFASLLLPCTELKHWKIISFRCIKEYILRPPPWMKFILLGRKQPCEKFDIICAWLCTLNVSQRLSRPHRNRIERKSIYFVIYVGRRWNLVEIAYYFCPHFCKVIPVISMNNVLCSPLTFNLPNPVAVVACWSSKCLECSISHFSAPF